MSGVSRGTRGLIVAVAVLLPALASSTPPPRWILAYAGSAPGHGPATYTIDDFMRLITVVDSTGQSRLWLTSGAIFLELFAPSGHVFEPDLGGPQADGADWAVYLDSLFTASGVLERLDSAVAMATAVLGPPSAPYQVSVMIPYPASRDAQLQFLGTTYSLWSPRGRRDVALAYIAEVRRRFQADSLRHLSLDGFYWLHELVPQPDSALLTEVGNALHDSQLRFLWIPYYDAPGWDHWRAFGFDEAWLQPNYFFDRSVPAIRLDSAVARALRNDMGLEIEFDSRLLGNMQFNDRLAPYLAALLMNPGLRDRAIAIYDGEGTLAQLSRSRSLPAVVRYRGLWTTLRR